MREKLTLLEEFNLRKYLREQSTATKFLISYAGDRSYNELSEVEQNVVKGLMEQTVVDTQKCLNLIQQ